MTIFSTIPHKHIASRSGLARADAFRSLDGAANVRGHGWKRAVRFDLERAREYDAAARQNGFQLP